ncbi:hypothetical protein [Archangium sp.]|uniref:hypothetical protein n=1 Tax=Archangium sp. TaxID=1872627 RepID=UPI00286AE6DE|nr:hypothetical protein [Archangium sp.]
MTKRLAEFEFEATCRTLGGAAKGSPEEAQDAIEVAAYALHFLYTTGQLKVFREYLQDVKEPVSRSPHIEREFANMTQASAWVHGQPPPEVETRVAVAGKTYAVWRDDAGTLRLVPAPSLQELEE